MAVTSKGRVNRRAVLKSLSLLGAAIFRDEAQGAGDAVQHGPKTVRLVEFSTSGKRIGIVSTDKVIKSDEDWKRQLTPEQYAVTRKKGTEMAFTGKYCKNHERGMYRCVCCGNALFSSETKFESGTGWPSFWAPVAKENVAEETDHAYGMMRTEVLCRKCDAHLGQSSRTDLNPPGCAIA